MALLCYCTSLRNAARRVSAAYDAALAPIGVGAAQFAMIRALDTDEPIALTTLGNLLDLDRSTVGRNVKVLDKMGLVVLGTGMDQRETTVELSTAGRKILKTGAPLWEKAQREFEVKMGAKVAPKFRDVLQSL
ncbi:MarR family winged helix-turn-helix transcriptional regulator [Paraburkholderia sp. BCC1885]|uniref:MarR family winged helix-turn-helix transcriptional regulator n=1 Tax=Paraburkholderia sp. BCC1885 TaxID=2562669 RepID=UPI00118209BC|nr:MarR family winged helix-turn-helix transcriptional regulator [Paraburkholderia sp. BCC1885]